jgi:hypothetical protein
MKILYLDGYTVEERKNIIPAIHQNIVGTFKDILKGVQIVKIKLPPEVQVCLKSSYKTRMLLTQYLGACKGYFRTSSTSNGNSRASMYTYTTALIIPIS